MGGVMIGSTGYNRVWAIIGLGHILFPHLGPTAWRDSFPWGGQPSA